jgi:hypothetical protein
MFHYSLIKKFLVVSCFLLLGGCGLFSKPATDSIPPPIDDSIAQVCECPSPTMSEMCDSEPEPEPSPAVCPQPIPSTATRPVTTINDRMVIGRVENVYLPNDLKFKARIDTGAGLSSIHVLDVTEFERDGKNWIRFAMPKNKNENVYFERPVKRYINIKQLTGEPQRRPIVVMSMILGSLEEQIEVTLSDRTGYLYEVLIGRNFLRDRAVVDVSKKFTAALPSE